MKNFILISFTTALIITCQPSFVASFANAVEQRSLSKSSRSNYASSSSLLQVRGGSRINITKEQTSVALQLSPAAASLFAGSLAGAIGVGVAFPLDTLKTKSQVLSQQNMKLASTSALDPIDVSNMSMFQLISFIYRVEGLGGFFGGVKGMMIGQALIKAVAFATNSFTLDYLQENWPIFPSTTALLLAACTAGFVTSFLVTPIERIKIMCQADRKYKNEFDCFKAIVNAEGCSGLFSRGLGPTLSREIPSYGIYFFLYGFLSRTPVASSLGSIAPLLFGALSGIFSWIPVYPIDVIKTLVQNTDGSVPVTSTEVAKKLFFEKGIAGFFDGLTPKMLRAAINHAVTFYCFDEIMNLIASK